MYKYLYVCVYVYINLKNMSTAHRLITKPHAQSPIHELPYQKKNIILFKRKNKNATLSPFNSTTPLLLFSL